ncbi:MAG: hypothetical protein IJE10_10745 [Clostridia bacterium]|nr:hypothetical protein [Clostridia bacterium]
MLEKLYTTKMSAGKISLQKRFTKIRSHHGKATHVIAFTAALLFLITMLFATVAIASVVNEKKTFFVNGKGYAIKPILIENQLEVHTDSYYVPLRDTFEALGYEVYYDVDKAKYKKFMGSFTFPQYDSEPYVKKLDDPLVTEVFQTPQYYLKDFVKTDVDKYIYGATYRFNQQMPIIEMVKGTEVWACQVGSTRYCPFIPAGAVVLINGKAYIPLRAVAHIVGGQDNVKWNSEKRDTYFEGVLTFNEKENTVTINLD